MATPTGLPVTGYTGTDVGTATDYVGPFTGPVLAAGQNPQRLFLLVFFSTSTGIISPAPGSQTLGFGPDVPGQPGGRLLHAASLPGVIRGEWYVYDSGGGTIRVYDVERDPAT